MSCSPMAFMRYTLAIYMNYAYAQATNYKRHIEYVVWGA